MNWDFHILKPLLPLVPFGLGIFFKVLLDFDLALWIVKYLYWIPMRWIFRTKPNKISGTWKQLWNNTTSAKYTHETIFRRTPSKFLSAPGSVVFA